ncbi:LOW QUALITY PROTEIN: 2-Hydroxyacid oxidase 2 [Erethizon dorsatum]
MSLVCLTDFQALARQQLSKKIWDFIKGGVNEEITRDDKVAAFKKTHLHPRYLRDVSEMDTRTTTQGEEISAPICIAPTGFHLIAWLNGELRTARAAQAASICYITSTYASCTPEDTVTTAPRGLWFQLYVQSDWELQLGQTAESLGFKALVITVHVPITGKRNDIRNQLDLKMNLMLKDFKNFIPHVQPSFINSSFFWNHLSLQSITQLLIMLKGILTKEDAELAVKHKVQGTIVYNLGGRQLDEMPASTDALTEVVTTIKGKIEVYTDSELQTGNDVLALALGTKGIYLGRPILGCLACKGEHGIEEVLNILKTEIHTSMTLAGCWSVAEICCDLIQLSRL